MGNKKTLRVGLLGYGKAGQAVARVLQQQEGIELCWILRQNQARQQNSYTDAGVPILSIQSNLFDYFLDDTPVDALIDFSAPDAVYHYGEAIAAHRTMLVSAISAYQQPEIDFLTRIGQKTKVLCSPNITLGINFLMIASTLLRRMVPFADVAILEQHFRGKPEISGTALKLADRLGVEREDITSLRLGGIIGQHEVIFGFPYQTMRLIHNSISREAFGSGAVFALQALHRQVQNGFYTLDQLLLNQIRDELHHM